MDQMTAMRTDTSLRDALSNDPAIGKFVDATLMPPSPHQGTGPIRLVILGQDPTVKNKISRASITRVLNLDRGGALHRYVERLCTELGLSMDTNVYAANYVNVFFTEPPAAVANHRILEYAGKYCLPRLIEELRPFTGVPVLTLGDPLLQQIVKGTSSSKIRDYWGYLPDWKTGEKRSFSYLPAKDNTLQRDVYPFPHQPSITKEFFSKHLTDYIAFMKQKCFS